jgi:broad specificity phosphatase PhoE
LRLILVRHGDVEESWLPDMGHNDPPLNDTGRKQAEALASELREQSRRTQPPEAVYTSPFRSARETANRIAEALKLEETVTTDGLSTLTPEVLPEYGSLAALEAIQENAWAAVESIKAAHGDEANLIIVTHDLPIRAVVCKALSIPLTDMRRFDISTASLTTIWFRGPRTLLAGLNDNCHLEEAALRPKR